MHTGADIGRDLRSVFSRTLASRSRTIYDCDEDAEPESGLVYQLKITLLEVEPSIWRHSAVRLERLLARRRVLLSKCESLENRTHPY